jgi:hypothetical protein
MPKVILKSKKLSVTPQEEPVVLTEPEPVKKKVILKSKKLSVSLPEPLAEPVLAEKKKVVLKMKKKVAIPPPPAPGVYVTKAMEAFEAVREYCLINNRAITEEDVKWYEQELLQEKKEFDEFWERCAETKANMECVFRGDDEWTTALAINAAKQKVKALPIQEGDIGPMPEYGTKDFWAWCNKRKKLKEQKDAAIIAAGGVVKEKKVKVKPAATELKKQVKP